MISASVAGSDYNTTTLNVVFEPSADGQTVCGAVPIHDDSLGNELNELFSVTITSVSNPEIMIGPNAESCVTIIDNDGKCCSVRFHQYLFLSQKKIAVPEIKWEERLVVIPEGEDRQVCFNSDIGTAQPYDVTVGVRGKGSKPAASGKSSFT